MLNILILGASSQIGRELALLFSPENTLTLLGRNQANLQLLALQCAEAGAKKVDLLVQDIAEGADPLMQKIGTKQYDLVINLVSATSRVKDSEFSPDQLEEYLMSDLLAPVQLLQKLTDNSRAPLKVIFISSVLASVKSPDRFLYGALKSLQEMCLYKLSGGSKKNELLVVKVGKVIPYGRASAEAKKLACAIYQAHLLNKKVLNYGLAGRVYLLLFYIHPLIFDSIVKLQRVLRERLKKDK